MRAKTCGLDDEQKLRRRLHYCGTCKTMGAVYGQKSRLLLNHDTVFLAEILTALGADDSADWQSAFQSYNCMAQPTGEMPPALRFAAAANVVLTEFKITDHLADEPKTRWRVAHRTFSQAFKKAAAQLGEWNFPLETLRQILGEQTMRENSPHEQTPDAHLHFLAEPTATATALFFAEGAKFVGSVESKNTMHALGAAFGRLVYLLDAFEDYEKDFAKNQFNAFRAAFKISESKLSGAKRREAVEKLNSIQNEITANLNALPIDGELKKLFVARLHGNLSQKLKTVLPVLAKVCATKKPKLTAGERWQQAKQTARDLTARSFQHFTWRQSWQYLPAFIVVALVAFVAPVEAAKAKSWQDCAGLGFNLMFLGSLVGVVLAFPAKMLAANLPPDLAAQAAEEIERNRRRGCCDSCDCGECCGECCGEGCAEACCCGCDSCDSCDCGGCCDGCNCD